MPILSMIRQKWRVIAIVTVVVLLAIGVVLRLTLVPADSEGDTGAQSSPQSSQSTNGGSNPSSLAEPEPTPTFTDSLEHFEPDIPEIQDDDCRNFMTAVEYAAFMERLYQFEVVSQMQPSDERLKQMKPFATKVFMDTQTGFFKSPIVEGVSVKVDPESAMACAVDSENNIVARITPTLTTVETAEDGSEKVLQGPMTLSEIHFTRWVKSDGVWLVDEERV